jgi:hypothetical protein
MTTARNAKGRAAIVASLLAVADKFGATVERRDDSAHAGYSGPETVLNIRLNGVGALIGVSDLHERHGFNGALISWHNTEYPPRNFTSGFNCAVGDSGSARPHHKATSSAEWDLLAARLQAGLRHAFNGTAFLKESRL